MPRISEIPIHFFSSVLSLRKEGLHVTPETGLISSLSFFLRVDPLLRSFLRPPPATPSVRHNRHAAPRRPRRPPRTTAAHPPPLSLSLPAALCCGHLRFPLPRRRHTRDQKELVASITVMVRWPPARRQRCTTRSNTRTSSCRAVRHATCSCRPHLRLATWVRHGTPALSPYCNCNHSYLRLPSRQRKMLLGGLELLYVVWFGVPAYCS